MDISKKDWKLFRERLSGWQENYMEGLVKEYANFLNDDKKPASEKFWELEKRIKEDKRHPGVIMEMSKSEVIWDIVRLIRLKVITYDDLSDFSDELQLEVKRIPCISISSISLSFPSAKRIYCRIRFSSRLIIDSACLCCVCSQSI